METMSTLMLTDWNAYKEAIKARQKAEKLAEAGRPTRKAKTTAKHKFDKSERQKAEAKKQYVYINHHKVEVFDKMTVPKAQPMIANPKRELVIINGKRVWQIVC